MFISYSKVLEVRLQGHTRTPSRNFSHFVRITVDFPLVHTLQRVLHADAVSLEIGNDNSKLQNHFL